MRFRKLGGKLEKRRTTADARLVLGLVLGLAVGAPAAANEDCEPVVTEVKTFTAGGGALRNTSTDGAQMDGSSKAKRIAVFVELLCARSESRRVDVELITTNNVGGAPAGVLQAAPSKVLSGGESARFEFTVFYDRRSCLNGEGPMPRDQGGVNQVNVGAFTFTAYAGSDENGGFDPGPNGGSGADTADLVCKPSRTTS